MRLRGWLILFCLLTACGGASEQGEEKAPTPFQFARLSSDSVAHGERLSRVLGCNGCHGEDLTGEEWSEPGFGRLWTANLSLSVPTYAGPQLAQIIRTGRLPAGRELWEMPSHLFTQLGSDDMAALIAYLRSRPPRGETHPPPAFEESVRREIEAGTYRSSATQVIAEGHRWPPDIGQGHAFARHVVRSTCAECHGMDLKGGQPNPEAVPRPDLRMVAAYEKADFHRLLRSGKAAGNREVSLMSEVARGRYRHLTETEIDAIYRYLQALGRAG